MRHVEVWRSRHLGQPIQVARWGSAGTPVLLFPTAGGDALDCERFGLVEAVAPLVAAGRIRIYSCDDPAGRTWVAGTAGPRFCSALQHRFHAFVAEELVPAIRFDGSAVSARARPGVGGEPPARSAAIVAAGASLGAFHALAMLCRRPELFAGALCLSGTFDLSPWLEGEWSDDFYFSSPLHFLPGLEGEPLTRLRRRFVLLAYGGGRFEHPDFSWRMAGVLGGKGIPNRVDPWGPEWDHDWPAWRRMLPRYLGEVA